MTDGYSGDIGGDSQMLKWFLTAIWLAIVAEPACAQNTTIQAISGKWYDATEKNGISVCKGERGEQGAPLIISESKILGDESNCDIRKITAHAPDLEILQSCWQEGTHSRGSGLFRLLDGTHLRITIGKNDSYVMTRCPNSDASNNSISIPSNNGSVPTAKAPGTMTSIAGDYASAIRIWRPLAERGQAEAQYNLGVLYEQGHGVPQDYREAVKWYQLSAEQGDALAQNNLGVMYAKGRGVSQNYLEAVKWYQLAAEQGYPRAQSNLGSMYRQGQGIKQDFNEALKWYRLAAERGSPEGQYSLGRMYETGFGPGPAETEDLMRAYMWLNLGASNLVGEPGQEAADHRDGVASRLTPIQLNRAQDMTRQCEASHFKNCDSSTH